MLLDGVVEPLQLGRDGWEGVEGFVELVCVDFAASNNKTIPSESLAVWFWKKSVGPTVSTVSVSATKAVLRSPAAVMLAKMRVRRATLSMARGATPTLAAPAPSTATAARTTTNIV